jgi:hypothetical protein
MTLQRKMQGVFSLATNINLEHIFGTFLGYIGDLIDINWSSILNFKKFIKKNLQPGSQHGLKIRSN